MANLCSLVFALWWYMRLLHFYLSDSIASDWASFMIGLSTVMYCTTTWLRNSPPAFWYALAVPTLLEHIPRPTGCWDPFGRTYALIMLRNTILLRSVTGSSSVPLRTTPHVLSVPIPVHMPLRYSTLWSPFSISPDLFQMKHIVSIYTQMFPPVSPVWILTLVPPVSFSVWLAFRNRTPVCRRAQRTSWSQVLSASLPLWSSSDTFQSTLFPALRPQPTPIQNPIRNSIFILLLVHTKCTPLAGPHVFHTMLA